MSAKINRGLSRIGILLSIIWIVLVAVTAVQEAGDRRELCAVTPDLGHCRHFFYTWQHPAAPGRANSDEKDDDGQISLHLGKLQLNLDTTGRPPVYRLDAQNLLLGLFGPLALLWLLGFGIAWCADGFREKK